MSQEITICRYCDLPRLSEMTRAVDDIFSQSSNTQSFADDATRVQFHERWLGRYVAHYSRWAYVALDGDERVAGYLVGCLDDPVQTARFSDIALYAIFANLTRRFPAHLHVNLAPEFRGIGVGTQLVARFCGDALKAGAPGVHVITSRGSRNTGFYARNGFIEHGTTGKSPSDAVFLARTL
jgi:GNAT superfamily N-acetyltransferase